MIAMVLIFIAYIAFLLIKFGRPLPSISESWYMLIGWQKQLFTLFCWSIGFLMFFQTDGSTGFFFLSGAGLCFVGAATMFRESLTSKVHYTGAIIAIFSAFTALYIERGVILPLILFSVSTGLLWCVRNRIWWIEIAAFVFIVCGLI